jgi:ribosomal protein L11 methylase PrmA
MLAIGAAILGAGHVCGFDVDPDALEIARGNVTEFEVDVDLVHVDLCHFCSEKVRNRQHSITQGELHVADECMSAARRDDGEGEPGRRG